jgi:type I restriction enzyme S subunit
MNKANWNEFSFGEVVTNLKINCNPVAERIEKFVAGEHIETDSLKIKSWGLVGKDYLGPAFHRKFFPNQILYGSRRTYLRKVAVTDFTGVCANTTFVFESKPDKLLNELLPFIIQSHGFTNHSVGNSKGSTNPFVNYKDLARYRLFLPPLKEQSKVLSVFQSIETAIEQAEQQEKNLKLLQKSLSNGLVSKEHVFGNLLDRKNCKPINFGGIVDCIEQHDKQKKDVSRFIGLENIEPENLKITTWGNIDDGTTFTKRFLKGDVLFGKRRAYLKKVVVADFAGICSSDILVFRAKAEMILPELLPYYASNDSFINHAVSTSAGSLSPRTKWRDLSFFELAIPDMKTQKRIVEVFQQLQSTLDQIKSQIQTLKNLKQKLLNEILG